MFSPQITRVLSRRILEYSRISVRYINFDGEIPQKTHMSMITREDESHNYIMAYSNIGFSLSTGINVLGPCAVFPRAVLHWAVPSADKITPESLSLFCMLQPKLDLLIIGKGGKEDKVDISIFKFLRSKNINLEILTTEQACSTFNFLNSERRIVAAALIPPKIVGDEFAGQPLPELDIEDLNREKALSDVEEAIESVKGQSFFQVLSDHELHKKRMQEGYQAGSEQGKDQQRNKMGNSESDNEMKEKTRSPKNNDGRKL